MTSKQSFVSTALRYAYLHGFASSPFSTKGVQLSQWFRNDLNITLDLPDLVIPSFRKQCLSTMVDHIEKKIIKSNSTWIFIGSSFGGLVSTLVTQRQPKLIRSLVLLAPALNPLELWTSKINVEQWKKDGFMNFFNQNTQRDESIDYGFLLDLQTYSSYPVVTTCPITIIHGIHDDVVPIQASREYMKKIRLLNKHSISLIEVDDDHYLRKDETLNTIKKVIRDFH
ncbi:unnamed protein product [Rotaria magnacalcarata]|uniref:Esterase n=2 Tax=Rotaria magnacalcarata TaxID=392030 RepID=A0A816MNC6_9BILA|nr:unnamed protein product [Rotaria magnacalcarata]